MRAATMLVPLVWALALASCEEPSLSVGTATPQATPDAPAAAAPEVEVAAPTYADADFTESESNRDPLRRFAPARPPPPPATTVRMPDTDVDQMRLVGIVSSQGRSHALVLDHNGMGHVLQSGEYLGRVRTLQTSSMDPLTVVVRWRVARIRDGSVVLERLDPRFPQGTPDRLVLPLRVDS